MTHITDIDDTIIEPEQQSLATLLPHPYSTENDTSYNSLKDGNKIVTNSSKEQLETVSKPTEWSGLSRQGNQWNILQGDALIRLKQLPQNTYNCIITSPPYFWLRDYGVVGQLGKEWTIKDYVNAIADVFDEVKRVLAPDGVFFLNIGDTYYSGKGESKSIDKKSRKRRFGKRAVDASGLGVPQKSMIGIPWRVALEMIERGWILRSSIIWDRAKALPENVIDRPSRTYENIFMFVKSRRYFFNQQALVGHKEDVWTISARPRPTPGISTAPFPDELAQKCIDLGCPENGFVLDPFAGSGTVLRVALQSGRNTTGIELNPDFCDYIFRALNKL